MRKGTKAEQADAHAAVATSLFSDAHDRLALSAQLAAEAAAEHQEEADRHLVAASRARETVVRSQRVQSRLADLLA